MIEIKTVLKPPCTYQGGKQRYAKQIIDIIYQQNEINEDTKFYDLCSGSGAISLELINRGFNPKNITMVDKSPWGLFYKLIGQSKFDADMFKKCIDKVPNDKNYIKEYISNISKESIDEFCIYKFLLLQATSFGGKQVDIKDDKWIHNGFRDYWQPTETSIRRSPVNPMQPVKSELFDRVKLLVDNCKGINCLYDDILDINLTKEDNSIIYIDPPYMNTTGYNNNDFNIHDFIDKNKELKLYISEGQQMLDNAIRLDKSGAKGGITAKKKSRTEEWLNIIN